MSVFLPRSAQTDQGFTPLFRLLEDFDSYQGGGRGATRGQRLPTFQPKFDVRETENAYELHGELPGMNKNDVNIEFSDPQTMVVRGRVERSYTKGTPPAIGGHDTPVITEAGEGEGGSKSHQATVEEEHDFTEVSPPGERDASKKAEKDNAKYWVSERSIGEFTRSFDFPGHVDSDAVSASLNNGILSVVVPKLKRSGGRRIPIQ